jgi:hypothetical protein
MRDRRKKVAAPPVFLEHDGPEGDVERWGRFDMKIEIKRVEAIKATRCHLDPDAGGA